MSTVGCEASVDVEEHHRALVLLGLLALVFTAANAADEDESVMAAMLRLAHLA